MQRDAIQLPYPGDGAGDAGTAGLSTVIVVAANDNTVAVNRRSVKKRAGISRRISAWGAAVRVGVSIALDCLDNGGWHWWRSLVGWFGGGRIRSSNDTSNSKSKDGEDLSELHLYRRLEVTLKKVELVFREIASTSALL
jgi:hypothetical protein